MGKKARILTIDDDPHIQEILRLKLTHNGYDVVQALDGVEGIKTAMKERPDLIVLDVMMPQMDGYQVCRFLRGVPGLSRTPIIFLTVRKGPGDRQRGLLRGGDDYIFKPFDVAEVEEKVALHLEEAAHREGTAPPPPAGEPARNGAISDGSIISVMNRQLDEHVYYLTLIEELSRRLVAARDRREILSLFLTGTMSEVGLGWDRALVLLVDRSRTSLRAEAALGMDQNAEESLYRWREREALTKDLTLEEVLDHGTAGPYIAGREEAPWLREIRFPVRPDRLAPGGRTSGEGLTVLRSAIDGERLDAALEKLFGTAEITLVPIAGREQVLGVVAADRSYSHRGVQGDDLNFLGILCQQTGLALERNELFNREKVRAEALEDLTLLNDSIMDGISLGVAFLDRRGRIGSWNRAMAAFTRRDEAAVMGREFFDCFPGLHGTFVERRWHRAGEKGATARVGHFAFRFPGGRDAVFDVRIGPVRDEKGPRGTVMIWEDVTERTELEGQVRESLQYLSNLFKHSADAILTLDPEGKVKTWNQGASAIFGYAESEAVGRTLSFLFEEADASEAARLHEETLDRGKVLNREAAMVRRDGVLVQVSITTTTLHGAGDEVAAVSVIIRDVTERKLMDSHLYQTEKLSSLGIMAAGMAHEINNPLTSIIMYSQILGMKKELSEDDRNCLEKIEEDSTRISEIIKNLLVYARSSDRRWEPVALHQLIDKAAFFIERQAAQDLLVFERDYDPRVPAVKGVQTEIHEILINLLINARDALPPGGTIRVTTRYHPPGEGLAGRYPEGYVEISVSDTGAGIPRKNLRMIFDPFFTTKPAGKGTGLGLAVVRRLVENHHGHIDVRSRPGQGTTFSVCFPCSSWRDA